MYNKTFEITNYFRNAIAAQTNRNIKFKENTFYEITFEELKKGNTRLELVEQLLKKTNGVESNDPKQKNKNILICPKVIKTIVRDGQIESNDIENMTGLFFIPAQIDNNGNLSYNEKIPWFPREFLSPIIEPNLSVGNIDKVNLFISKNLSQIEKIKNTINWDLYYQFLEQFYEEITDSNFKENITTNNNFEFDGKIYLFIDNTINATFHISKLYDYIINKKEFNELYSNFTSIKETEVTPLHNNSLNSMEAHCGQMGGEYPLSPSQREAINHFNNMQIGEILAVNGPPGTGKTTLLQSVVATLYVERALKKEKAPIIVATSTNNQAVINIITSFANINKVGVKNLEDRWIDGVSSFAAYFPSDKKMADALKKGYQCTNQTGKNFVESIETKEFIDKSKEKFLTNFNKYFGENIEDLSICETSLHHELVNINQLRKELLNLTHEIEKNEFGKKKLEEYLKETDDLIEIENKKILSIHQRLLEWSKFYKSISLYYKIILSLFKKCQYIENEFRLFISGEEIDFIDPKMSFHSIKAIYAKMSFEHKHKVKQIKAIKTKIEHYIEKTKEIDKKLAKHIDIQYPITVFNVHSINNLIDYKIRYIEFWIAVHYYECRWLRGESLASEKQKGKTFKNVLDMFYHRLAMITPCMVMTFFMLPKQFMAYDKPNYTFLKDFIDLLIVDEAGQVSPEIAACAFWLAQKAIVVGDVFQIEPVWGINRALDKSLAISSFCIRDENEFNILEDTGLNTSSSSVMKVAGKACKYKKNEQKGLFLSEHRRCYDEIINYSNELVYNGNLEPKRGKGKEDNKRAIKTLPQIGYMQIDSTSSIKHGGSRRNDIEAQKIGDWISQYYDFIKSCYPNEQEKNLLGIITPFKAQAECIRKELASFNKKDMVDVGTVHTFQGAERKIIILSTVYGRDDGCFFIDANKSLMNVAISRAKDHFFVFGEINCLANNKNSASGLLKKFVENNKI